MCFMDLLESELMSLKDKAVVDDYRLTSRAFTLEGKWSFFEYVLFILTMKGQSLTNEIENFVDNYFNEDESKLLSKSAVSKQRAKFSYDFFKDLNKDFY